MWSCSLFLARSGSRHCSTMIELVLPPGDAPEQLSVSFPHGHRKDLFSGTYRLRSALVWEHTDEPGIRLYAAEMAYGWFWRCQASRAPDMSAGAIQSAEEIKHWPHQHLWEDFTPGNGFVLDHDIHVNRHADVVISLNLEISKHASEIVCLTMSGEEVGRVIVPESGQATLGTVREAVTESGLHRRGALKFVTSKGQVVTGADSRALPLHILQPCVVTCATNRSQGSCAMMKDIAELDVSDHLHG